MKNEVDSENQKVREMSDIFSIEIVSGGGRKDAGRERQLQSKSEQSSETLRAGN